MAEGWSESVARRRRILCRNFIHGACKWGHSCYYSHDLSLQKSSQICRHYLNGFCFYGDRCRYQHIRPTAGWSPGSRRGSEPALQLRRTGEPSRTFHEMESRHRTGGYEPKNRRSSAPTIQRMAAGFSQPSRTVHSTAQLASWSRRGSEPTVSSSTHLRNTECFGRQLGEEAKDDKENETPSKWELGEEFLPWKIQERDYSSTSQAAGSSHCMCQKPNSGVNQKKLATNQAFEMSKDIICGICMDKVYEKTPAKDRCFAILPDCNHAFCVTCIKKWRHSKGFTNNIIKACPECRVVSSYYIPHRYWVVDEQKQELIDKFKAEKRKIRCKFFLQSNGKCPFKSECIYLHEFPEGYRPTRHQPRKRNNHPSFGLAWNNYDDYDEDDDFDRTLHLFGVLSLDSFLENADFHYEFFDSDLSDFSLDYDFDSSSDDDD
ncbi:makorin, ring finger protein, 4 isoform X2 [Pristis pectinata]|uniref:makorin, ring finger protein, 4 isoform X2 n=1 Tax=Pristis pectinata TaxID=685728 RepID=UPI00223CE14A|nr:makorin, ring finger protein, 4 isoform X2 [Pristis pectinata]